MDKKKLYQFSLELKKLLQERNASEVEAKILRERLSKQELDFLFQCLHADGYDPITDRFLLCESDNSAFLNLVSIVQSKVTNGK